ncbi:MAG: hypothetical protein E2601_06305 [Microbacterium sp.]|nr:hypothetical protein [Microbacterium sp.]
MKLRNTAWAIAVVAVLGLSACSASPSTTDAGTSKPSNTSSAPAEQKAGQSVADACAEATARVEAATQELSSISDSAASADPQGTLDAFSTTVDAIGAATDATENPGVKATLTDIYQDFTALRDLYSRVLIDQDATAATDMETVMASMQESATAFSALCTN